MAEVTIAELNKLGVVAYGDGYRTKRSEHGQPGFRILRAADVLNNKVLLDGEDYVRHEFARSIGPKASRPGDVLLTTKGTVGRVAIYPHDAEQVVYSPQLCYFRVVVPSVVHPRYLAYWFRSSDFTSQAADRSNNTDMAAYINLRDIASLALNLPDIGQQRAIAEVLGALDDKIAANDRTSGCLERLVCEWFEAGLALGQCEIEVASIAEFHNRRRVPLSSREREARRGEVPYFGAAGRLDFVDEAIFDEPLVLVGEDGSVIRDDGRPVVQYIWGPSWVNNHAHVLTGRSISTELLRVAIQRVNVAHLVTGAVQPKISMGNLKSLMVAVPEDVTELDERVRKCTAATRALTDENRQLTQTRDELLPLLMSGKVRVRDAERRVEDAL
jgi:type I restriction enzyme S subunit